MSKHEPPQLLRPREGQGSARVTNIELFFDLVFVFAITQLSHTLLQHLDFEGAAHTLLLFLAVWWVWIFTSWITNWLDPEKVPVRLMLLALMLAGLVLSSSLPQAFASRGLAFAVAYVVMQVGRSLFTLWAVRHHSAAAFRNFVRISCWLGLAAPFWIIGGMHGGRTQWTHWSIALFIEYLAPLAFFWVPGLGRSRIDDWDVQGSHLAERCSLFVIIALGESILVTGATFAEMDWTTAALSAFVSAFLGSVAMWWIYFDTAADRASERISKANEPGRQARSAYTYLHLIIVAGIVVCAVADELTMAHPEHADTGAIVAILGGPALYVLGNALFKWNTNDRRGPPLSHLIGIVLFAGLALWGSQLTATTLGMATTAVLVVVAAWESASLRLSTTRSDA